MFRRLLIAGALMLLASQSWGGIQVINLTDSAIVPDTAEMTRGDTIRWIAVSGVHYLQADSASLLQWHSDTLNPGDTFDLYLTHNDPGGKHFYHCTLHPSVSAYFRLACCKGPYRGNVDYSFENGLPPYGINVQDLNYHVAYMFSGGPPPPCIQEADSNGNGSTSIIDLNYLISYMFSGGPRPIGCP